MKTDRSFHSIALLALLLKPGLASDQSSAVTWSQVLKLDSLKDLSTRLAQPFGDVFTGAVNGKRVLISNCQDYLHISPHDFRPDNDREARILHNDAIECTALKLLSTAHPPTKSAQPFSLSTDALRLLPPELAPAVSNDLIAKAKLADSSGKSWATYLPESTAKPVDNEQLDVLQPGWRSHLTLYAMGDFTGGGNQQFLIRADYQAIGGTYSNSKLFLLAWGTAGASRLHLVRQVKVS